MQSTKWNAMQSNKKPGCGPSVICFTVAIGLFYLGIFFLADTGIPIRIDSQGQMVLDASGEPLLESNPGWNWQVNWFSGIVLIIALLLIFIGTGLGIRMMVARFRK